MTCLPFEGATPSHVGSGNKHSNHSPILGVPGIRARMGRHIADASSLPWSPWLQLVCEALAQKMLDLSLSRCKSDDCRLAAREAEAFFRSPECNEMLQLVFVDSDWFQDCLRRLRRAMREEQ